MPEHPVKDAEPISVVGLGKVGLGLAASLARNGFDVLGIDRDGGLVDRINAGTAECDEPGVEPVLRGVTSGRLRASVDMAAAAAHGHAAFVLLPTPNRSDGSLDATGLAEALTDLCGSLRTGQTERFTIIVGSTVSPGTMTGTLIPAMERALQRGVGGTVSVCYSPELVALGSVVENFERPDLIIIGADDPATGAEVERIQRRMVRNNPAIHHMSPINAEIAKIALNNFLTVKISFANFLSQVCASTPGAEVDTVTDAIGSDRRIGGRFLRAGPAFGGPCFPRDTAALAAWAASQDRPAGLVDGVVAVNRAQHDLLARTVRRQVERVGVRRVAVLGLAYKASTPYVMDSAAIALINTLHADEIHVIAYDPLALDGATRTAGGRFEPAVDAAACVHGAPVIILMHPEAPYIDAILSYHATEPKVIVDCWRALGARVANPRVTVVGLGQVPSHDHRHSH